MSKIQLTLNEEQEIQFKLSIKGSTNELDKTKPTIRFIILDKSNNTGLCLPTKTIDESTVVVTIPKNHFLENVDYAGNLEVIVGSRYFTPANLEIEFVRGLDVQTETTEVREPQYEVIAQIANKALWPKQQPAKSQHLSTRDKMKDKIKKLFL